MDEQNDNLLGVLATLFRWKKPIMIVCGIVAIGSIIISLLLPVYYESKTVFYSANPALNAPSVIFGTSRQDLDFYGDGDDIDRLISIASSNNLIDYMVDNFNLYEHYEIDQKDEKAPHKVRLKFLKRYQVIKNQRDGIELSVEDVDRELAAKMANAARNKIDEIAQKINQDSQNKLLSTFEKSIQNKQSKITSLSDSLTILRKKYGVYMDFGKGDSDGAVWSIRPPENNLEKFNEGLSYVQILTRLLESESTQLAEEVEQQDKLKSAFSSGISAMHVQDIAAVPIVKSRPKRSLIVLTAVLLAFILSALAVLILDRYKDVNWKAITSGS